MIIAAFVVSIFAALFAGWQALEARRTRIEARYALEKEAAETKASASAAERSAKAAEQSAETASKGLTLTRRAYVALNAVGIGGGQLQPGRAPIVVQVEIKNLGVTPAREVIHRADWALQPPMPPGQSLFYVGNAPAPVPLAPGQPMFTQLTKSTPLSPEELAEINRDEKQFLVWGLIEYKDIFGHQHSTKWCRIYHPSFGFIPYERFNDMD